MKIHGSFFLSKPDCLLFLIEVTLKVTKLKPVFLDSKKHWKFPRSLWARPKVSNKAQHSVDSDFYVVPDLRGKKFFKKRKL